MHDVHIIDFGSGNLSSVSEAFKSLGASVKISDKGGGLNASRSLVIPGVGSFPSAMKNLKSLGLDQLIIDAVDSGKPILGICLGMQLLFEKSSELELTEGLGILKGEVERLPDKDQFNRPLNLPSVGWRSLECEGALRLDSRLSPSHYFYFVHSYQVIPADTADLRAIYRRDGGAVTAIVARDNVCGMQFHPEMSGIEGLGLLREWVRASIKDQQCFS